MKGISCCFGILYVYISLFRCLSTKSQFSGAQFCTMEPQYKEMYKRTRKNGVCHLTEDAMGPEKHRGISGIAFNHWQR